MRQKYSVMTPATRLPFLSNTPYPAPSVTGASHRVTTILCIATANLMFSDLRLSDQVSPALPTKVVPENSTGSSVAQTRFLNCGGAR
jgi:hypothetical protein